MQGFQPQSLQYQSPPPPFTGPSPFMNQGPPINQGLMNQPPTYFNQGPGMNHPPAMQNMGFPPPQNNVMQSGFGQPNFMSPPPVNQGYGAPNFPVSYVTILFLKGFVKIFGLTLLIEILLECLWIPKRHCSLFGYVCFIFIWCIFATIVVQVSLIISHQAIHLQLILTGNE